MINDYCLFYLQRCLTVSYIVKGAIVHEWFLLLLTYR